MKICGDVLTHPVAVGSTSQALKLRIVKRSSRWIFHGEAPSKAFSKTTKKKNGWVFNPKIHRFCKKIDTPAASPDHLASRQGKHWASPPESHLMQMKGIKVMEAFQLGSRAFCLLELGEEVKKCFFFNGNFGDTSSMLMVDHCFLLFLSEIRSYPFNFFQVQSLKRMFQQSKVKIGKKRTWHWKSTLSSRSYIYKWWMLHCCIFFSNEKKYKKIFSISHPSAAFLVASSPSPGMW